MTASTATTPTPTRGAGEGPAEPLGTTGEAGLAARLAAVEDHLAIEALVHRLGSWLDEGPAAADPAELFTADIAVHTPGGCAEGREHVVAQARRNHDHVVTQHVFGSIAPVVDAGRESATASASLVVRFAHATGEAPFYASGNRYRFTLRRAGAGPDDGIGADPGIVVGSRGAGTWRVAGLVVEPVWDEGERPAPVAA